MTTLTSRELNQDIGRAKREAELGPVFITDRGKPAHVLLSIEDYRRLTGKRRTLGEALAMPGVADIDFDPRLDHMNFRQLDPGTAFGRSRLASPLDVRDEGRRDVADEFFACGDGTISLRRASTPAMLTLDVRAVRQDCLCYLMERLPFPPHESR